jgi:hypothetical protein
MIRNLALASAVLALAACDLIPAGAPPARAPDHPSQSHPVTTAAVRQAHASSETRQNLEAYMKRQLDTNSAKNAAGRTPVPGFSEVVVTMQPGADHQFRVSLASGTGYSFMAACDDDCNDVDLELLQASDGLVVGSDLLTDDYPVVHFNPPANGDYYVRIILKTCTNAPCYVGARVLQGAPAPK